MMNTIVIKKRKGLLLSLMLTAAIALLPCCKDDDSAQIPGTDTPLATPKDLSSKVRGTTVTLAWRGNTETVAYEVELSRDGSESVRVETDKAEIIFEALKVETNYTVSVRALAVNAQYNSDRASLTFTTGKENILQAAAKDISDVRITVNWTSGAEVTHFTVYPESDPAAAKTYQISDSEKAAGEKTLDEFNPETAYEVELYNGANLRGSAAYTTTPRIYAELEVTAVASPIAVILQWAADEDVSHFVITPADLSGNTRVDVGTGNTLLVGNLKPDTEYTFEAWMGNSLRGSNTFSTTTPEKNLTVNATPISSKTALVEWDAATDSVVTRIRWSVAAEGTEIDWNETDSRNLTAAEKTAGEATVAGLNPDTKYVFLLQAVFGETVYDRGVSPIIATQPKLPGKVYMPADGSGSIAEYMTNECISGDTLVLAAGKTYTVASLAWPNEKSLTIAGANTTNKTVISITGGTFLTLPASVDSIIFRNLNIVHSGGAAGGAYFVNQGATVTSDVDKLVFDGCTISGFGRSLVRLQADAVTAQKIDLLKIKNSIIADCGNQSGQNYSLIQSTTFGLIGNIQLTNSTFNNISKTTNLISGSSNVQVFQNIAINNCTFYNVVGGLGTGTTLRYLIDAGASAATTVNIRNSILGKVVDPNSTNNRGTRGCTVTVTDTYQTSDWVTGGTDIPNTTSYAGSAADLFTDPANGNFQIKDNAFAGKATAGDPRWR